LNPEESKVGTMRNFAILALAMGLAAGPCCAWARGRAEHGGQEFVGQISDSLCGLKHPMSDARRCTLGCVKGFGAKFVLADLAHNKVYKLSNQGKARPFAGEMVDVTGTLDGDMIHVTSIRAAQNANAGSQ
jgi:hypothetical protein